MLYIILCISFLILEYPYARSVNYHSKIQLVISLKVLPKVNFNGSLNITMDLLLAVHRKIIVGRVLRNNTLLLLLILIYIVLEYLRDISINYCI